MLPSRGIARFLPSAGVGRRIQGRRNTSPPPTSVVSARLGTGRPLGVFLRSANGGCSPLATRRHAATPVFLGAASTPRTFSLWGYGKSNTPPAPADAAAPATVAASAKDTAGQAPAASVGPVDPTPDALAAPPTEPPVSASDVDLSSIADLNAQDILGMPEQLGYLHAIGLDYGWGPTSLMQWALEHVHIWTGFGWAASIVTTAVALRCVMFYPQVRALQFGAVMHRMKQDPRAQEAHKLLQLGYLSGDTEMRQRGQILNKMLREQYGTSNWGVMWSMMQIPFTFGMFRIVSGMTNVPVPSMETGGYLWFPDLTATDPYFILPAVGTGLMVVSILLNAKHSPPSQQKLLKPMMYVFGVIGFFCTTFLSAAVNLMTVAVGASTLVSAVILSNARLRRTFGLPIYDKKLTPKPPVSVYSAPRAAPAPERAAPTALRERLTNQLGNVKKGLSEQVINLTGAYTGTDQEKAERKRKDLLRKLEDTRKSQEREEFAKKYKKR